MAKIAIIGAGGYVFPLRLIADLLSFPELTQTTFALMDTAAARLQRTAHAAEALIAHYGFAADIEATTDRRTAVSGADYVIVTFQVGGLEAYHLDVVIPRRYGIDQPVGDTLGPGGVFRFLRSAEVFKVSALDMAELCPDAMLLNYANPMAMNCLYLTRLGVTSVGLCHSVQNTTHMLAAQLGVPYDEVSYLVAGLNHQAWILQFRRGEHDLYPQVREAMRREHLQNGPRSALEEDAGDHSERKGFSIYEGGQERVRTTLMEAFGYFHTESSHHASEYLPYFRKDEARVAAYLPERWDYYEICSRHDDERQASALLERLQADLKSSLEYGASIIHSLETGVPRVVYGNVPNRGLISNLPDDCCVEVPCLVDKNGLQPTHIGALPPQCAAVNGTNVNVQMLAVEAALMGRIEHVYHAVMLDPLTASILPLEKIRMMTDDLLQAQRQWLPAWREQMPA
ncbi:alpha-glucosidase/alpha-galactosidase [soil metagenome]